MKLSLTYDQDKEMTKHKLFTKGTEFDKVSRKEIKHIQNLLNSKPRKTLGYQKPDEVFKELINN